MAAETRKPAGRLLKVPEVADRLGLGERTVIELLDTGQIPRVRIGRRAVRIDEADVAAFIAARKTTA